MRSGIFGSYETAESVCARNEYEIYMSGYMAGFDAARANAKLSGVSAAQDNHDE